VDRLIQKAQASVEVQMSYVYQLKANTDSVNYQIDLFKRDATKWEKVQIVKVAK